MNMLSVSHNDRSTYEVGTHGFDMIPTGSSLDDAVTVAAGKLLNGYHRDEIDIVQRQPMTPPYVTKMTREQAEMLERDAS